MKAKGHTLPTKWKRMSNHSPLSDPWVVVFSCSLFWENRISFIQAFSSIRFRCHWLFTEEGGTLSDDAHQHFHNIGYGWGCSCSSEIWVHLNIINATEVKLYKHIIPIINSPELKTGVFVNCINWSRQAIFQRTGSQHWPTWKMMWNWQTAAFIYYL